MPAGSRPRLFSTDTWAVFLSLGLVLLVRFGLLKTVSW